MTKMIFEAKVVYDYEISKYRAWGSSDGHPFEFTAMTLTEIYHEVENQLDSSTTVGGGE